MESYFLIIKFINPPVSVSTHSSSTPVIGYSECTDHTPEANTIHHTLDSISLHLLKDQWKLSGIIIFLVFKVLF